MNTITTHYIDGSFVESYSREVMDIIKPTNGEVIARVASRWNWAASRPPSCSMTPFSTKRSRLPSSWLS